MKNLLDPKDVTIEEFPAFVNLAKITYFNEKYLFDTSYSSNEALGFIKLHKNLEENYDKLHNIFIKEVIYILFNYEHWMKLLGLNYNETLNLTYPVFRYLKEQIEKIEEEHKKLQEETMQNLELENEQLKRTVDKLVKDLKKKK